MKCDTLIFLHEEGNNARKTWQLNLIITAKRRKACIALLHG